MTPGQVLTEVGDDEGLVAGIVHDAALCEEPAFLEAVAAYSLIALKGLRLTEEVESSLRELHESRARIASSADGERRRIERDLHDGAQQRLVALRIQLELAEDLVRQDPELGVRKLHALGEEVGAALEEIRALAGGVYPVSARERGLAEALRAATLKLVISDDVSKVTASAGIPGTSRARSTSAAWRRCRTPPSTPRERETITVSLGEGEASCGSPSVTTASGFDDGRLGRRRGSDEHARPPGRRGRRAQHPFSGRRRDRGGRQREPSREAGNVRGPPDPRTARASAGRGRLPA